MAEQDQEQETAAEEEAGKSRFQLGPKAKWAALGSGALLLLVATILATLFLLGAFDGGDDDTDSSDDSGTELVDPEAPAAATPARAPAMYFPVKPAFVINYQSGGRTRFLQVEVSLLTRDQEIFSALQQHLPLIKNRLVLLFSGEVFAELQTNEGKELMRQKALTAIQEILVQEVGREGVEQVLFTDFVMQ